MCHMMEICEKLNNISRGNSSTFSFAEISRPAKLESTQLQPSTISKQVNISNNNIF